MKRSLLLLFLPLLLCCGHRNVRLQNGDLVFVGIPAGYKAEPESMDEAISAATGEDGALNLIHAAIAEVKGDSVWIIDATIARGVDRHPLDTFLKDFRLKDGSYPEFIVKRAKGIDAEAAVERAKTFCGRAYDVRFLPDNEDMYCTELVQKCYLDASCSEVFASGPMNFKAPDGTMPPYWVWLFGKLGMDVPQGIPGTNPQDMCSSPLLEEIEGVYCFSTDYFKDMAKIYDFKTTGNKGTEVDLAQYKGKVLMIVNTASKCGFTPQYDGLEALYQKYKDQGLVIIGFPCDQFAGQEPGSNEEIAEFCRLNHGVTFPLMAKTDVNGPNAEPVFEYLKAQAPEEEYRGLKAKATRKMLKGLSKSVEKESDILWNFTKFLVNRDGSAVKRYAPVTKPEDIEKDIQAFIKD